MGRRPNFLNTSTHNLCFSAKIRKIMNTPVHPNRTNINVRFKGSELHGHVSMMSCVSSTSQL